MSFQWQINDKLDVCVRIKNKPKDIRITNYDMESSDSGEEEKQN